MWAILFCSVIALAVAIDRFLVLRRAKINLPAFTVRIRGFIKNKDMSGAASFCLREKSPIGNMVRKGLKKFGMGHERVKESEKITQDMFEEEINNFVHAARRAVTLLSRIRLARELGTSTVLTERNLYEAIGWDGGDLEDLIRFIHSEWHEDFSDCVKLGTLSGLGAWVDSMWGA